MDGKHRGENAGRKQGNSNRMADLMALGDLSVEEPPKQENSRDNRRRGSRDTTNTKIFVGGLAWETKAEALRDYFKQYGEITEAVVLSDKHTGRSKGYGFVTFATPEGAARACLDPNPMINKRKTNCNLASLGARRRYDGDRKGQGDQRRHQRNYNGGNRYQGNKNSGSSGNYGGQPMVPMPYPHHAYGMAPMFPGQYYFPHPMYAQQGFTPQQAYVAAQQAVQLGHPGAFMNVGYMQPAFPPPGFLAQLPSPGSQRSSQKGKGSGSDASGDTSGSSSAAPKAIKAGKSAGKKAGGDSNGKPAPAVNGTAHKASDTSSSTEVAAKKKKAAS